MHMHMHMHILKHIKLRTLNILSECSIMLGSKTAHLLLIENSIVYTYPPSAAGLSPARQVLLNLSHFGLTLARTFGRENHKKALEK
jgi:hypothetical protein